MPGAGSATTRASGCACCAGARQVALALSAGLWLDLGPGLALVLLLMFTHTSAMMPMSEAALAHLVSRGRLDARLYGRVRLCARSASS